MNSKKCLASLIDNLGVGSRTDETLEELRVFIRTSSSNIDVVRDSLEELVKNKINGWSINVRDGEYLDISPDEIGDEDLNVLIKKPIGGRAFFATTDGFISEFDREELILAKEVLILDDFRSFRTRRFWIKSWDGELMPNLPEQESDPDEIDPRIELVRDLTAKTVPYDPYRWILTGPESEGGLWREWQKKAALKLSTIFISELWIEGGAKKASLHGARKKVFDLGDSSENIYNYKQLKEAAEWLLVKQDADARHEVLVRRLTTLIWDNNASNTSWIVIVQGVLNEALNGARLDHRAYVRSKSTEAVRAVADLRKAVGEDVSKIIERVHRLTNGFIVGLAALAAGLGIRLTLLTSNSSWKLVGIMFCIIVLCVTWAGTLLQRHVSTKSLVSELRHMRSWHKSVHVSLSRAEYKEIALRPVLDAVKLYKSTMRWMLRGMVVASIVFFLGFVVLPVFYSDDFVQENTQGLVAPESQDKERSRGSPES